MSRVITIKKTILLHFTAEVFCDEVLSYSRHVTESYLVSNIFVMSRDE